MCFFKDFIKNLQTTIALTFLPYIISAISGVWDDANLSQISKSKMFLDKGVLLVPNGHTLIKSTIGAHHLDTLGTN